MRFVAGLSIAIGLAAAASATGQQPPVFKAGVDLVAVDVTVVDDQGRPIRGLRTDQFTVTVDGKPRRVVSADFVAVSSVDQTLGAKATLRRGFSTNAPEVVSAVRRVVLLVIDQDNIQSGMARTEIDEIGRFIDRFAPDDLVGLAAIPGGPSIDFTTNRVAIRNALRKVVGRWQPFLTMHSIGLWEALGIDANDQEIMNNVVARECAKMAIGEDPLSCQRAVIAEAKQYATDAKSRSRQAVTTLRELVKGLSVFDGTKTLVFASQALSAASHGGGRVEFARDARDVAEAAARSRVGLYVLKLARWQDSPVERLASETASEDDEVRGYGLETLASMARGAMFLVSSSVEPAMTRISLESSGYYLLGFEPLPSDQDGKRHNIDVKVAHPGVTIRARREFAAAETVVATKRNPLQTVTALLGSQSIRRDVPLRIGTHTIRDAAGDKLRVIFTAEVGQGLSAPEPMTVGYVITDVRGRVAGNSVEQVTLAPGGPVPGPAFYMGAAVLPTGNFRVRFVAVDKDGRQGTVEHSFEARLTSGQNMLLGDLMVLQPAGKSWRPSVDGGIANRAAMASLEIYSRNPELSARGEVRLEIADSETGPSLATSRLPVSDTNTAGRLMAQGPIDLGKVAASEYLLRAVVVLDGKEVARTARPIRVAPR
ncbi:MAG TPA: VWA domain-containing protein [Vicinamibacterales bacterium]|jgi:VWFA-related protein